MDNASKALVMAGAILIAIMLISLGVLLFNQAQQNTNDIVGQFGTMSLSAYNKNYTDYVGANKSASDVKALLGRIRAHNNNVEERTVFGSITATSQDFGATGGITAQPNPDITNGAAIRDKVDDPVFSEASVRESKYYYIVVTEYNQQGAVSGVTVYQQSTYFQN